MERCSARDAVWETPAYSQGSESSHRFVPHLESAEGEGPNDGTTGEWPDMSTSSAAALGTTPSPDGRAASPTCQYPPATCPNMSNYRPVRSRLVLMGKSFAAQMGRGGGYTHAFDAPVQAALCQVLHEPRLSPRPISNHRAHAAKETPEAWSAIRQELADKHSAGFTEQALRLC